MSVPATVPGGFVVDLLEETGRMDREKGENLKRLLEVEVRGGMRPDTISGHSSGMIMLS